MKPMRSILLAALTGACLMAAMGCRENGPSYGVEARQLLPGSRRQVWAVAPVLDLSGQPQVDPLLQADLLYQQLQQVEGLTVIPVNRVVEVYVSLRLDQVQSPQQAALICEMLGCDALVVASVTAFDPYHPPKFGAALQLFSRGGATKAAEQVDPHELVRQAAPAPGAAMPAGGFLQVVGMYDASNGSVQKQVQEYADGRNDPRGALRERQYLLEMDRYCGFAYHQLIGQLLEKMASKR